MSEEKEIKINFDEDQEQTEMENKDELKTSEKNEDQIETEASFSADVEQDEPVAEETEAEPAELTEEDRFRTKAAELEDRLLRTMADFDNYKKRTARQYDDMIASANERLIKELLEIVDNFERALAGENNEQNIEAYRKGVELIFSQLQELLKRYDVKPIEALGRPFDPEYHEALMQIDSDEYDEGIVAVEMSKGYTKGNKVIRHSKVGVSKGKAEGE